MVGAQRWRPSAGGASTRRLSRHGACRDRGTPARRHRHPGRCSPRREETRSYLSNTSPLRAMTTSIAAATVTPGRDPADYDDDALDRLAELIADRVAARLGGLTPGRAQPEPLVDAAEIARLHGKTRSWVYEHAGELGAVRLGSGPRPRLAFSPARVAERLEKVDKPTAASLPKTSQRRRRRQRAGRTASGAPLLHVRSLET